jgi:small ligand-binding sensory domain FIST
MPYAASCSRTADSRRALDEVFQKVSADLNGVRPDLSFLFASRDHAEDFEELAAAAGTLTNGAHILGCTGESIAAGGQELEEGPALSLWSAVLSEAKLEAFHVEFEGTPDGPICSGLPEPGTDNDPPRAVFLLADPYTCAVDTLIARLADDLPGVPLIGGMASGGAGPGENRLMLDGKSLPAGGVGVVLRAGPQVHSVVSQGCRPIGSTFVVTKVQDNVILELGGKTALSRLEQTYAGLSEEDRHLIRRGLHVGIAMNEYKPAFSRGDFLISNVLGADRESGAIAIGNFVRTGQTVQFHVRDAETADEDLRQLLAAQREKHLGAPGGALLFSCNGRGTKLFPKPDHDAGVVQELCGPLPLAGFFAQGELGPVGGRNYIHGFTASVALFEDTPAQSEIRNPKSRIRD